MDENHSFSSEIEIAESTPEPLQSVHKLHDPFDWYKEMRDKAPVRYDPHRDVYDVFTYKHVRKGLEDGEHLIRPNLSSSESDTPLSYIDNAIVWTDGPDHNQSKGQLFPSFTPNQITDFRDNISTIVEKQIRLTVDNTSRFDFVTDFAAPVPLRVIMDFVGVPDHELDQILDWLLKFRDQRHSEFSQFGNGRPSHMSEAVTYFKRLIAKRRSDPGDDLISRLVTSTTLDEVAIGANCFNFILAGQGTLTNLLSDALYTFAKHNLIGELDQYDLNVVIEEVLRYRAPLQSRSRVTTQPLTLGGTDIPEGETVILWIGSANRDPARFTQPDSFLPERNPDHLSFGRGPHTCIGAPLARLEAPIVLQTFFDTFDQINIGAPYQPTPNPSELGFERLPVEVS